MFFEGCYDILNTVTHGVGRRIIRPSGITMETLLLLLQKNKRLDMERVRHSGFDVCNVLGKLTGLYLQVANNAVGFSPPQATGGRRLQVLLPTH